jgi:Cu-Zn family superoxide dismutase
MTMNTPYGFKLSLIGSALVSLAGCALVGLSKPQATAVISPTSSAAAAGMKPEGTVTFVQLPDGLMVSGRISGLRPGQTHGFHIHDGADCSGDAMGTKGHFNPKGAAHGKHDSGQHHAGDLPALVADAYGVAEFKAKIDQLTVEPDPMSVVGRGLIVHRDPDDYTTQPTGNAGPRPGCGVIKGE